VKLGINAYQNIIAPKWLPLDVICPLLEVLEHFPAQNFHFPSDVEVRKKDSDVKILNSNILKNILRFITAVDPGSFFLHSMAKG